MHKVVGGLSGWSQQFHPHKKLDAQGFPCDGTGLVPYDVNCPSGGFDYLLSCTAVKGQEG